MERYLNFRKFRTKTINSFHYQVIFTKMIIIIDELIYSNKQNWLFKICK